MKIRDMETDGDAQAVREMHARRGLPFELPNLQRELSVQKLLTEGGQIVCAALLRPTTEAYIICDRGWSTPWMRWQGLRLLHDAVLRECREKGIEDTQAVLDPPIERPFGERLLSLGWARHKGVLYSRKAVD